MRQSHERRMLRVLEHIHSHPADALSLDAMADLAAMSRFHWHRVFHAMTGETLAQAVRRIRMHRASIWLVQSQDGIAQIATRVGYPNVHSFTRSFRAAYGLSPAAFRKRGTLPPPHPERPKGEKMYPITIQERPKMRLAGVPHQGAYPEIGRAFQALSTILTARNLWPATGAMVAVFLDDPMAIPEADLRSIAGVSVKDGFEMTPPLAETLLPAGRYAVLHHHGPYAGLKAAWDHLYGTWLPTSGEDFADHPPIEVYLNSPIEVAPDDLRTDICVPLV